MEYNSLALAQGISPRDHCWASIQMKYIDDDSTLMQYASFLHLATPGPNVILIDDLDRLTAGGVGPSMPSTRYKDDGGTRSRDAALCRVLAVLCDSLVRTIHFITSLLLLYLLGVYYIAILVAIKHLCSDLSRILSLIFS